MRVFKKSVFKYVWSRQTKTKKNMAKAVEKSLSKYVWKRKTKSERVDLIKYRKKGPRLKFELLTCMKISWKIRLSGYEHKMSKEYLEFGDDDVEKWKFHSSKNPMTTDDVVIGKILISIKFACEKRALIVLSNSKFKNWLCLYVTDFCRWLDLRKNFDNAKSMFFFGSKMKNYCKKKNYWENVSNMMKKGFW